MNIIDNSQIMKRISNSIFAEITEKYNISQNEHAILIYLSEADESNNTAKDIVDTFMFTKSHVSKSIDSLIEKGYVTKKHDLQDKKKQHLILTEESKEIIDTSNDKKQYLRNIILEGFDEEEVVLFKNLSNKIFDNIKKYYL